MSPLLFARMATRGAVVDAILTKHVIAAAMALHGSDLEGRLPNHTTPSSGLSLWLSNSMCSFIASSMSNHVAMDAPTNVDPMSSHLLSTYYGLF